MLQQNVGIIDRIIRVVGGLGLLAAGPLVITGVLGTILAVLGVVLVVTGAIGFCPLYLPFKLSTRAQQ